MDFKGLLEHHILDHIFFVWPILPGVSIAITKHLVMMWIAGALILLVSLWGLHGQTLLSRRVRSALEAGTVFIRDQVVLPSMGEGGRKYLSYFLSLFFFILVCNLLGLVPYGATATGNIAVTATLALCTFFLIHLAGIREQGLGHYVKSIVPSGLPKWLIPLMFPIELIGFLTKTFALTIRLFANMIAGHIVVLAFLALIFLFGDINQWIALGITAPFSIALALFISLLELLIVAPLQAYIFTFLTALFVGAAMHPEH